MLIALYLAFPRLHGSTLCPNPGEVRANEETAAEATEMVKGWSTWCLTALGLFSLLQEKGRFKGYFMSISHCPACARRDVESDSFQRSDS